MWILIGFLLRARKVTLWITREVWTCMSDNITLWLCTMLRLESFQKNLGVRYQKSSSTRWGKKWSKGRKERRGVGERSSGNGKGRWGEKTDKSQSKMLQQECSILANLESEKYIGFNVLFFQLSCRFENLKKKKKGKKGKAATILY